MDRHRTPAHSPGATWPDDLAPFLRGDRDAADRISRELLLPVRRAVRGFLGADHADAEDTVQESVMAVLRHLRREGGFQGDLIRFAVTVARNRCRNLLNWRQRHPQAPLEGLSDRLADPHSSALDLLLVEERHSLLRRALARLEPGCRRLLQSYYLEKVSAEQLRQELGLGTVQAVHYRKSVCLDRAFRFLNEALDPCSSPGQDTPGGDRRTQEREQGHG